MKQYERLQEAKKAGNEDLAEQILGEEYGGDSTIIDVEVEVEPIVFSEEEVMDSVAAGLSNKEIADKFGISVQKIGSIKKKAK